MKLLFLATGLLLAGCQGPPLDADSLPPVAQTGTNTGGFLLDGQPFLAATETEHAPVSARSYRQAEGRQFFIALNRPSPKADPTAPPRLEVVLDSVTGPGIYRATTLVNPKSAGIYGSRLMYWVEGEGRTIDFVTGPTAPGRITITHLDTVTHIIAGTFEAELREAGGSATHRISRGRFDCVYVERK